MIGGDEREELISKARDAISWPHLGQNEFRTLSLILRVATITNGKIDKHHS